MNASTASSPAQSAMNTTQDDRLPATRRPAGLSRPVKTALLMVALVGGLYLLREHWSHIGGNWVYLLLLACPLMHVFHGHGRHGGGGHCDRAVPSDTHKE